MKNSRWPWITLLSLCAAFAVICVMVALLDGSSPQPQPSTPAAPQWTDHAEENFQALFANPDWESLYALAGMEDTPFENAATFASYMVDRVGQTPIQYREVRTDLPNTHRYILSFGSELLGSYHLTEPDYTLSDLTFSATRNVRVTIQTPQDYTVFVNGVALDDAYTVKTLETKAEKYLPNGIHGKRLRWQTVENLLCTPEITAADADGKPVELVFANGVYCLQEDQPAQITQQQIDFVTAAATADAQFAIGEISKTDLAQYFDITSSVYLMLITNPRNLQKYTSSTVEDIEVGEFMQYSDTLFSANVKLTQKIIRTSGTLKTYTMDKTYFFALMGNGQYLVTAYTNEHVTQTVEKVRLTFHTGSQPVSMFIDTENRTIAAPQVENPENFRGWGSYHVEDDGTVLCIIRIMPDGKLLGDAVPLTVYPIYQ